jgi:hypothetical protein
MNINIEIESKDNSLVYEMIGGAKAESGEIIKIGDGTSLKCDLLSMEFTDGIPQTFYFVLNITRDIGVGLASAWLYDKLKNRNVRLKINRTVVEIDQGEIKKMIDENRLIERGWKHGEKRI